MRQNIAVVTLLIIVGAFGLARGQDIAATKLSWNVNHLKDLASGDEGDINLQFITHGFGNISWVQKSGIFTSQLVVSSVSGAWANVSSLGSVTYNISIDGQTGTLVFERTTSGVFITIDLSQPNAVRLRHRYTVQTVSPL